MKLEILIKEFRDAIKGSEELEPSALANLNAAIDTAERRIIRKNPESPQSPLAESPLAPGGGTDKDSKTDVIEFVNGYTIAINQNDKPDTHKGLNLDNLITDFSEEENDDLPVIAPNAPVAFVKRYCLDCDTELPNDLFERCMSCLDARM